ncbi:hypothetical protein AB0C28_28985 [Nonomuraea sp. NPDC048892]|uniref:hypothetical protein n=1 Tax=Nonomuraea sp. NPDC048892 TaxID=3154624 RepID=UPI0033DF4531
MRHDGNHEELLLLRTRIVLLMCRRLQLRLQLLTRAGRPGRIAGIPPVLSAARRISHRRRVRVSL